MKQHNAVFNQRDFSKQDLSSLVFKDCKFYQCNFSRTNLQESEFVDCSFIEPANLTGCDFSYSDLRGATFKNCQLSMSDFRGAKCFSVEFLACDLKGADFLQVSFSNQVSNRMYFCSALISACNLSYANFERQCIEKCDLTENKWLGTNLQGASLKGSDLSRGIFSQDCWNQIYIQGCNLRHAELNGLDPRKVDLTGVTICSWQQEEILEQLGLIVAPD